MSQLDAERYIASVIPALDYSDFKKVCLISIGEKMVFLKTYNLGGHGDRGSV